MGEREEKSRGGMSVQHEGIERGAYERQQNNTEELMNINLASVHLPGGGLLSWRRQRKAERHSPCCVHRKRERERTFGRWSRLTCWGFLQARQPHQ